MEFGLTPVSDQLLALVESLPDPVFILTESGIYADVVGGKDTNRYHDASFLIGKRLSDVLPYDKARWFLNEIELTLDHGALRLVEYDLAGTEVDGLDVSEGPKGVLRFEGRIVPLTDLYLGERAVIWMAINITEKFTMRKELERLSLTDELSGAHNRRSLTATLTRVFKEYERYRDPTAIAIADIDWFKRINDSLGHTEGDRVLKLFVESCDSILRSSDFLARYGGDEFVVIFSHTEAADARQIMQRLAQVFSDATQSLPCEAITISVGISTFHVNDKSAQAALERADKALYAVKANGRAGIELNTDICPADDTR